MVWLTSYACTGCDGGHRTHWTRHGAWRLLVMVERAGRKGYPLAPRCGGELYDVVVRRSPVPAPVRARTRRTG